MRRNLEKNDAICFLPKILKKQDQELHFHSYLEIYCVVKGDAFVAVCGDNRLLTQGQMVIVNPLENHSCEAVGDAEVFALCIGSDYIGHLPAVYPGKRLPRWLTDDKANSILRDYIRKNITQTPEEASELQKNEFARQLFSMIIAHYGLLEHKEISRRDQALVAEIVQYIYDNSSEKITLEILAKKFYISPTFLSKKLRKQICMDLRAFVNDIRVCKAIRMMDTPEGRNRKIEDIAFTCGFSSMSTFYRCYKRNDSFRKAHAADKIPQE